MKTVRIALVQFAAELDDSANLARIDEAMQQLTEPVDLIVLPEASMHDFGSPTHDLAAIAQPLDGPFFRAMAKHASNTGAVVVAGMFEIAATGLPYNTLIAVRPDHKLAAVYRKIHLYDSFGYRESQRLSAGPIEPVSFDLAGVRIGLMTCYDLRFPEQGRMLLDVGAELMLIPSAWVAGPQKLHHWRTLVQARAIENTVPIAAAAQCGRRYTGHSLVVDAQGTIVEEAGNEPAVLIAEISREHLHEVRRANPSLANRRIGLSR